MAMDLNLKAHWLEGESVIQVSWNDHVLKSFNSSGGIFAVIAGVGCLFFAGLTISTQNVGWLLGMVLAIAIPVMMYNRPFLVPKVVEIGRLETMANGQIFPTAEITRFDYGSRSSLSGVHPPQGSSADPIIIRMWLNDSRAITIAEHNWQNQISHEIRDTLARALEDVRNLDKQDAHEAEFGKSSGDFGVPDY